MTTLNNRLISGIVAALLMVLHAVVFAETGNTIAISSNIADEKTSMAWPLLPHENLQDLARLFYPKSPQMQRQFVQKTLRLNQQQYPELTAESRSETLTSLRVPTLKSLASTRPIRSHKPAQHTLKMSYGLQALQAKAVKGLLDQYQTLLTRNTFLKEELAKLNQKLERLQQKMQDLKLMFDKTLRIPQSKLEKSKAAQQSTVASHAADTSPVIWKDYLHASWVQALLGFGLLTMLVAVLLRKNEQRKRADFSAATFVNTQAGQNIMEDTWLETEKLDMEQVTSENPGVFVEEFGKLNDADAAGIMDEARLLASVNRFDEAIAHLKDYIETNPKVSIQPWLYLLEIYRQLDMRDAFEQQAQTLHQTFNIITPTWEEHEVAMVVAQSLEEFPHIVEHLHKTWPGEEAVTYLRNLINDNRNGERSGFGRAVIDEILLLISVLGKRGQE